MVIFIGFAENFRSEDFLQERLFLKNLVLFGGGQPVGGYWLPKKR
jgi:hypothetical protein